VLWLRDSPIAFGLGPDGESVSDRHALSLSEVTPRGLTPRDGFRSPIFRRLIVTFLVLGFAMGGMLFQMFPILTSLHVAPALAATVLGSMGLALIAGRACCGFLMDRFFAPRVAVAFLVGPIIGCALLATGIGGVSALAATLLVGLAGGAEIDVLAYLIGRYLGTRAYATFYAWIYLAWSAGSGVGPLLAARISDVTGSYSIALWVYASMFVAASVLLLSLGRFPRWLATAS
jgi:MFS family permease